MNDDSVTGNPPDEIPVPGTAVEKEKVRDDSRDPAERTERDEDGGVFPPQAE